MEIELRPLNLGEILDRTFQIYRARFLTFVGIASLGACIYLLCRVAQVVGLRLLLSAHVSLLAMSLTSSLAGVIVAIVFWVTVSLVLAAINCAVIMFYLGRAPGIARSYSEVWPRWFRYVRLNALVLLICGAPGIVPLLAFLTAAAGMAARVRSGAMLGLVGVSFLLMAVAFPFCLWLLLRYSLANAVCTFENAGIRRSMKRSVTLSLGLRWQILGLLLLVLFAQFLIGLIFLAPSFPALIAAHGHPSLGITIYSLAAGFFNNLLMVPVLGIGLMLFYFDARIRKEGFDVQWMLERSIEEGMPQSPWSGVPVSGTPALGSAERESTGSGLV